MNSYLDTSKPGPKRGSRDEMNLAEFPLTVLSKRAAPGLKTLEFNDSVKGKNGDLIQRKWIITGADKFGLPTSSDDEVLLGLLKLTVDDGIESRKVYFTRYELLKILRWSTEGRSYQRLQKALDRLSGVRIKATNAFYDNDNKRHSTKNFGIIDEYEINSSRDTDAPQSFFVWSDVLFQSFQVGFIKKLDLDFYLSLRSAISKRLYRYLDKHFWYKSSVRMSIFTLCHEKIGVSRNYKYASSLCQQLDPALEELKERGFLEKHEYSGRGKKTELTLYAARGSKSTVDSIDSATQDYPQSQQPRSKGYATLKKQLISRGLHSKQVPRLIGKADDRAISKMLLIVKYYDHLLSVDSALISHSPVGFLYRAIEHYDDFQVPSRFQPQAAQETSVAPLSPAKLVENNTAKEVAAIPDTSQIRSRFSSEELRTVSDEVEHALSKLRGLISEERFQEAIEHGINQKLLKMKPI